MEDDEKVVPFRGPKEPVTPNQLLLECLQETRDFEIKHAFVMLMDENGIPSFWATNMKVEQLCKLQMDIQIHVMHHLMDSVKIND